MKQTKDNGKNRQTKPAYESQNASYKAMQEGVKLMRERKQAGKVADAFVDSKVTNEQYLQYFQYRPPPKTQPTAEPSNQRQQNLGPDSMKFDQDESRCFNDQPQCIQMIPRAPPNQMAIESTPQVQRFELPENEEEFQIRPQKIEITAESLDPPTQDTPLKSFNEEASNPYNLQANITHRSEFLICTGADATHEHLVSQEEQLTGSQEIELAESANAYTDSNGDTEYDGACHSAAITVTTNSAYQHTMSSAASSRSRAAPEQTSAASDSLVSQEQNNSNNVHEKSQNDEIILIEAPSKELDQDETSNEQECGTSEEEESGLSSEGQSEHGRNVKQRLFTICEGGSSISESHDFSERRQSKEEQTHSVLSKNLTKEAVDLQTIKRQSQGPTEYHPTLITQKTILLENPRDQNKDHQQCNSYNQDQSSFQLQDVSQQQDLHLTGDLLADPDDVNHLTSLSSAEDKQHLVVKKQLSQSTTYNESSTSNMPVISTQLRDFNLHTARPYPYQNQGQTDTRKEQYVKEIIVNNTDQQGEGNNICWEGLQIDRYGANTGRHAAHTAQNSFEAATFDAIHQQKPNDQHLNLLFKQNSQTAADQRKGSQSSKHVAHFSGQNMAAIQLNSNPSSSGFEQMSKKESQRYRDVDQQQNYFAGLSEDEMTSFIIDLEEPQQNGPTNEYLQTAATNPCASVVHHVQVNNQQSRSALRSSYYQSSVEDSIQFPYNIVPTLSSALMAVESRMQNNSSSDIFVAAADSDKQRNQNSTHVLDSISYPEVYGGFMTGTGRPTAGFYGLEPVTSDLMVTENQQQQESSNTKSAIPLTSEMQEVDLRMPQGGGEQSRDMSHLTSMKDISEFKSMTKNKGKDSEIQVALSRPNSNLAENRNQVIIREANSNEEKTSGESDDSLEWEGDSQIFDERAQPQSTVYTNEAGKPLEAKKKRYCKAARLRTDRADAYRTQPVTKTEVFAMKPVANQMSKLYGDSEVRRLSQTEDDPSTIEKTVKCFINSSCSKNNLSTERNSLEFRDPKTKQVFLKASVLETEANLKRLSEIISENEEASTLLRQPQELGTSSSATSHEGSEFQSRKLIAGQNISLVKSILQKMLAFQTETHPNKREQSKEVTSNQRIQSTKVDVQWTQDEMKALTSIFKSIVQNDLEKKSKYTTKSSSSIQSQKLHKQNSESDATELPRSSSKDDFANLQIPQTLKQPVRRTNTSTNLIPPRSSGTSRQKSGKVCSHKQGSRKLKRHSRHASENISYSASQQMLALQQQNDALMKQLAQLQDEIDHARYDSAKGSQSNGSTSPNSSLRHQATGFQSRDQRPSTQVNFINNLQPEQSDLPSGKLINLAKGPKSSLPPPALFVNQQSTQAQNYINQSSMITQKWNGASGAQTPSVNTIKSQNGFQSTLSFQNSSSNNSLIYLEDHSHSQVQLKPSSKGGKKLYNKKTSKRGFKQYYPSNVQGQPLCQTQPQSQSSFYQTTSNHTQTQSNSSFISPSTHLLKPGTGMAPENANQFNYTHSQSTPIMQTQSQQSAQQPRKSHKNVSVTKISLSSNNTPLQSQLKTPTLFKGGEPMVNLLRKTKQNNSQSKFTLPFQHSKPAAGSPAKDDQNTSIILQQGSPTKKVANLAKRGCSIPGAIAKSNARSPKAAARPTIQQLLRNPQTTKAHAARKGSMGLNQLCQIAVNPDIITSQDSRNHTRKRSIQVSQQNPSFLDQLSSIRSK